MASTYVLRRHDVLSLDFGEGVEVRRELEGRGYEEVESVGAEHDFESEGEDEEGRQVLKTRCKTGVLRRRRESGDEEFGLVEERGDLIDIRTEESTAK